MKTKSVFRLVDAGLGEPREELGEGGVVGGELRDVAGFAGTEGAGGDVIVVRVGDVRVGDGNATLLHGRDVAERHRRAHAVEAGKADVAFAVGDDVAVEIGERRRRERGRDVLVAEERAEAVIPARLVGQKIVARVIAGAGRRTGGAMHGDADEVCGRLRGVALHLVRFG